MSVTANRPLLKTDANRTPLQWSYMDMAKRAESSGGNIIYFGLARAGSAEDAAVWKIEKYEWDGDDFKASKWPLDTNGLVSTEYRFKWSDRTTYTYQ